MGGGEGGRKGEEVGILSRVQDYVRIISWYLEGFRGFLRDSLWMF